MTSKIVTCLKELVLRAIGLSQFKSSSLVLTKEYTDKNLNRN